MIREDDSVPLGRCKIKGGTMTKSSDRFFLFLKDSREAHAEDRLSISHVSHRWIIRIKYC